MNNSIALRPNSLPARKIQLTEQIGNIFLATMKDMGKQISFSDIVLGSRFAAYFIDAARLSFPVSHIEKQNILDHLAVIIGYPVYALRGNAGGMMLAVDYDPPSRQELPEKTILDINFINENSLQVPLGLSENGMKTMQLNEMGHTLIVGMTGSGKSVWLHSAIASLLCKNDESVLKIALADAKRSEMIVWANTPHNLHSITYDVGDTEAMLQKIVSEMDRRGELFQDANARNIKSYNERADEKLPYILVVLDEGLDLLSEAGANSDLSLYLRKIGMRGRSAGVFIWLATQHSTALAGIPRTLALNMMTRLVFRVADGAAARNAGCPQSHRLPKIPGRFMMMGKRDIYQACYLDDKSLQALSDSVSTQQSETETLLPEDWLKALRFAVYENNMFLNDENIRDVLVISRNAARRMQKAMLNDGVLFKDVMNGNAIMVSEDVMELLQ